MSTPSRKTSLSLPTELIELMYSAVYYSPGLTLSGLARAALRDYIQDLEQQRGAPFPRDHAPLRRGRPVRYASSAEASDAAAR